jgi:hypothetical protein
VAASEEAVAAYRALAAARPDAFAPDLARSLGMLGQIALSQDPDAAVEAFAEGMRVLSPLFRAVPQPGLPVRGQLERQRPSRPPGTLPEMPRGEA